MDLFFRDEGDRQGLPVVLIHAFPFDHAMWEPQVAALRGRCRVITYDIRGLGRTPAGPGPALMEGLVDDLFDLLDHLGIADAVLCGLSLGGFISLRAAERAPKRVRALILADTRSAACTEQGKLGRIAAIRGIEKDGLGPFAEDYLKKVCAPRTLAENGPCLVALRDTILHSDPKGVCWAGMAMINRTDTTPSLSRISVPTLVLWGEDDSLTPPTLGRAISSAIPGARFTELPGASHLSNLDDPEGFNKHILDFLQDLPR